MSAHDNLILWDKIEKTVPMYDYEVKLKMHMLALAIILTSFGMVFIQSGTEFVRTKKGHHNSYNAGDEINKLDWKLKEVNFEHYKYIKDLIKYRKQSAFFHWNESDLIEQKVKFINAPEGVICYGINGPDNTLCIVIHNGSGLRRAVKVEEGVYKVIASNGNIEFGAELKFSTKGERPVHVDPYSTVILEGPIDRSSI